jgi:DNA-binding transcriptional MerR regulator/quercetin dioxygenase-like cupin family protein
MSKKRTHGQRIRVDGHLAFTISEASRITNVSRSTLRIWESAGLTQPTRTRSGYRTYSSEQIERLKQIQRLRTEKNLNVAAIRHLIGSDAQSPPSNRANNPPTSIGEQLRRLRENRGLSIFQAAEGSGLSSSYLSSLERGQSNASVATLQRLSVLYQTNVLSFFTEAGEPKKLVRLQNRKQISNEPGITIELLASGSHLMEPHLFRLAPGATSGGSYNHEGEEFIFILQGSCEICLDQNECYKLRKGDSLYFSSMQQHRWRNTGRKEAILFWVNTPPTF